MAKHYLKEWRKHRGLTQDQVVDRLAALDDPLLPQTSASLSRLENGRQQYSERIMEALAEIYETEVQWLVGRNPLKQGEVVDFTAKLTESQMQKLRGVWELMNGTDGE